MSCLCPCLQKWDMHSIQPEATGHKVKIWPSEQTGGKFGWKTSHRMKNPSSSNYNECLQCFLDHLSTFLFNLHSKQIAGGKRTIMQKATLVFAYKPTFQFCSVPDSKPFPLKLLRTRWNMVIEFLKAPVGWYSFTSAERLHIVPHWWQW